MRPSNNKRNKNNQQNPTTSNKTPSYSVPSQKVRWGRSLIGKFLLTLGLDFYSNPIGVLACCFHSFKVFDFNFS